MKFAEDVYDNIASKVGMRLAQLRIQKGYKQQFLEKKLGMTHQRLSNIERGVHIANYKEILQLCEILDTDPVFVLSGAMTDIPKFAFPAYIESTEIEKTLCWISFAKEFEKIQSEKKG